MFLQAAHCTQRTRVCFNSLLSLHAVSTSLTLITGAVIVSAQHDNPNVELDVVLAVLSGGPVGIGDGINLTNVSLAKMTADRAGRILRASKPLTALDSTFVPPPTNGKALPGESTSQNGRIGFLPPMDGARGCDVPAVAGAPFPAQCAPAAEQTHTSIPLAASYVAKLGLTMSPLMASWRILVRC